MLEDEKAKLATMFYQLPSAPAGNPTFYWMTDQIAPKADTLGGALSSTTLTTTTADFCKINDIVKVPSTGETVLVTARGSSTSFTVTRSWGAVAQDNTKTTGEPIINLGPAFAQGAGVRVSASDDTIIGTSETEVSNTNYTQIWRHTTPVISRTLMETDIYGAENERKYQQRKKALEHVRDQNLDAYFMEKNLSTNRGTSGGLYEFVASGNVDTTATLTETAWNSFLKTAFRYGSEEKYVFVSTDVNAILSEFASVNQRVQPGETQYGIKLAKYQSPHGLVNLVVDYALEGATYKKYAFVVDKNEIRRRVIHESELQMGIQLPDVDGTVDSYLCEAGWEWGDGNKHAVLNSVTG